MNIQKVNILIKKSRNRLNGKFRIERFRQANNQSTKTTNYKKTKRRKNLPE
jgi:hypothetical protein